MKEKKISDDSQIGVWVSEKSNDNYSMSFRVKDVLFSGQSEFQRVDVVDTFGYGKMLLNDGLVMVTEADEFIYHEMISHVPLFLHPEPKRVLVIGGGDGGTVREVLKHPSVEKCTLVEIDEMVINACKKHITLTAACLSDNKRVEVLCQDGVKYAAETKEKFDVILVDSTDPVGPGAPLFGDAFYSDLSACLSKNGIVVSQGESPFIYAEMQKTLVEILNRQFKETYLYNYTNMTYPSGLWSFSLATNADIHPIENFYKEQFDKLNLDLQYYTPEIHKASFYLPAFQKKRLKGLLSEI